MARFIVALNQSLDGYVDHDAMAPDAVLFQHFIDDMRTLAGVIYGRRMYEVMRYWDEEQPGWDAARRDYADAWRAQTKWVVSRTLREVGPNAHLIGPDLESELRALKARTHGDIGVAGPQVAAVLADLGLIDEYRLYTHPVVTGGGKPFFPGPRSPLRFIAAEPIGNAVRLTYAVV